MTRRGGKKKRRGEGEGERVPASLGTLEMTPTENSVTLRAYFPIPLTQFLLKYTHHQQQLKSIK